MQDENILQLVQLFAGVLLLAFVLLILARIIRWSAENPGFTAILSLIAILVSAAQLGIELQKGIEDHTVTYIIIIFVGLIIFFSSTVQFFKSIKP